MKTLQNWVGFAIKTDLLLSVFDFFLGLLERNYSMFHGVIDSFSNECEFQKSQTFKNEQDMDLQEVLRQCQLIVFI